MRVLHILDHSIPLQSGYTFRTLSIVRGQRALGWETFHLTGPKHAASSDEEEVDDLHFFRTVAKARFARVPVARELEQMLMTSALLEKVARRVRPDVLHAHSPVLNALPALHVGKRLGIPVVYEVRAFWEDAAVDHGTSTEWGLRYRATRALETWALKRAGAVTTICDGLRNDIVARGVPPERVTVIPNAVDVAQFPRGGQADPQLKAALGLGQSTVLGFVGSFYAYEGLELLLSAMPAIVARLPDVKLLLVGGGPEDQRLRKLAAHPSLEGRVVFSGRVPHADVQRYYNLLDVLVYPRLPMRLTDLVTPLKPLEAMAQEKLFVASDVGGHKELIRDGETGVLFRAGDADDLAGRVVDLVNARERWPALRAAGRRYVENERSWTESVARYRRVYANARAQIASSVPVERYQ